MSVSRRQQHIGTATIITYILSLLKKNVIPKIVSLGAQELRLLSQQCLLEPIIPRKTFNCMLRRGRKARVSLQTIRPFFMNHKLRAVGARGRQDSCGGACGKTGDGSGILSGLGSGIRCQCCGNRCCLVYIGHSHRCLQQRAAAKSIPAPRPQEQYQTLCVAQPVWNCSWLASNSLCGDV